MFTQSITTVYRNLLVGHNGPSVCGGLDLRLRFEFPELHVLERHGAYVESIRALRGDAGHLSRSLGRYSVFDGGWICL